MKTCSKCKQTKQLSEFGRDKNKVSGYKYMCRLCHNQTNTEFRSKNPESYRIPNLAYGRTEKGRRNLRANALRRKFWPHLTNEQAMVKYEELLSNQNYSCALCGLHKNNFKMALAVDHDHATKQVRGLLCNKCNRFEVGRHTIETASKLVDYLKKAA